MIVVTGSALQQGALQDVQRHAWRWAYLGVRLVCYQSAPSANPSPVSRLALTSCSITALTAPEERFCAGAAISSWFRPRRLTSCRSRSCHLRFTFTRLASFPVALKPSCPTSHLSSCLDILAHHPPPPKSSPLVPHKHDF